MWRMVPEDVHWTELPEADFHLYKIWDSVIYFVDYFVISYIIATFVFR